MAYSTTSNLDCTLVYIAQYSTDTKNDFILMYECSIHEEVHYKDLFLFKNAFASEILTRHHIHDGCHYCQIVICRNSQRHIGELLLKPHTLEICFQIHWGLIKFRHIENIANSCQLGSMMRYNLAPGFMFGFETSICKFYANFPSLPRPKMYAVALLAVMLLSD